MFNRPRRCGRVDASLGPRLVTVHRDEYGGRPEHQVIAEDAHDNRFQRSNDMAGREDQTSGGLPSHAAGRAQMIEDGVNTAQRRSSPGRTALNRTGTDCERPPGAVHSALPVTLSCGQLRFERAGAGEATVLLAIGVFLICSVLLSVAGVAGQSSQKIDTSSIGPSVGQRVPDISGTDQYGRQHTLASSMGARGAMLVFFRSADW
jgi:hypothetical protein